MNLLEIRTEFVKISGRYDLVNPSTFADNGADKYITMGQRDLERRLGRGPTAAKFLKDITAGTYLVSFEHCRVIQSVSIADADGKRELLKYTPDRLRAYLGKGNEGEIYTTPLTTMDRSRPLIYYPINLRRSPDGGTFTGDSATLQSYLDVSNTLVTVLTGIVLLPPADASYVLEIEGVFYNKAMASNTDVNFWSEVHPQLLIQAALMVHDKFYRGKKSSAQWEEDIESALVNIEKDTVDQESTDIMQMEG
jgi:hypothetical protein